ncbi:MAG: hypothetical protein ABI367_07485 [Mucilaginibacter sp.]
MDLSNYLKKYDTLVFSAIGFYLIYLYTRYSGIGISPDSIMYTSAARSFSGHGTLTTFNNSPIVDFPVFYPLFLGVITFITRIDPIVAAPILNGLLFATVIYLCGWLMQRFNNANYVYKWLMLIAIVLSPSLLQIYTYLWSETLFILLSLVFIIAYKRYLVKHNTTTLLIVAFIAALSTITRYAGVTIIGTGGLLLLLDRNLILKKKIIHIIIYSVTAVSLLVLNLLRNALLAKTITGPREPSITSFSKNVYYLGTVLCDWLNISEDHYYLAMPLAIIILAGITGLFIYHNLTRKTDSYEHIILTFTVLYAFFMVISATFSRFQQLDTRLLAPLFIPLLWSCTWWCNKAIKKLRFNKFKSVAAWSAFALLLLIFSYNQLYADIDRYDSESDYGVPGYTDDTWNKSPFVNFLKYNTNIYKPGVPIYSNAYEAVYFASGVQAKLLPHQFFTNKIAKFYAVKHYYLVWFNNYTNPELIDLKDILKRQKLVKLYEFKDGAVYEY